MLFREKDEQVNKNKNRETVNGVVTGSGTVRQPRGKRKRERQVERKTTTQKRDRRWSLAAMTRPSSRRRHKS